MKLILVVNYYFIYLIIGLGWFTVFNATFNNISAISWRSLGWNFTEARGLAIDFLGGFLLKF